MFLLIERAGTTLTGLQETSTGLKAISRLDASGDSHPIPLLREWCPS